MTTTFTASNGVSIKADPDGIMIRPHPTMPWRYMDGYCPGTDLDTAMAEWYQHRRDVELGRWRDEHDPDMVVYPVLADPGTVMVIAEREGVAIPCSRDTFVNAAIEIGDDHTFPIIDYDRTAARYFAAHPEPKPWHDAKPGEVWVLETELHPEPRAFKVSSREGYATSPFTQVYNGQPLYTFKDGAITAGRRIWPEESDDE